MQIQNDCKPIKTSVTFKLKQLRKIKKKSIKRVLENSKSKLKAEFQNTGIMGALRSHESIYPPHPHTWKQGRGTTGTLTQFMGRSLQSALRSSASIVVAMSVCNILLCWPSYQGYMYLRKLNRVSLLMTDSPPANSTTQNKG